MAALELHVRAFGTVHGVCIGDVEPRRAALLRAAWSDLLTDDAICGARFPLSAGDGAPEAWVARMTELLTSALLRLGDRSTLFLHASAVAAADGSVFGFLGPSGAGKTTLVRALGRTLGYVTDEALAIHRDGRVSPYRKPLSVIDAPREPKRQIPPAGAVAPLPDTPLRLAALCLVQRDPGATAVEVSAVPLATAIVQLVPQSSFLAQLPAPLVTVAALLERTGGLRSLRYREASDVERALEEIRGCRTSAERWRPVLRASDAVADIVDAIAVDDDCLVFDGNQVVHLVGLGATIWQAIAADEDPVASVVAAHGVPPHVDATAAVDARITQLIHLGTVRGPGAA